MTFQSLQNLALSHRDRDTLAGRYFRNIRAALLITVTLSGIGLVSFFTLPRELNPEIRIPMVFVTTTLPGADPADIESLVTIPLEDALDGLDGLETFSSSSRSGASSLTLEFSSGLDPEKVKADVQSAVDTVRTLPDDANDPLVQVLDFQNEPVLQIAVTHETSPASLVEAATRIRDHLKDLPGIKDVTASGLETPHIDIVLRPEKAAAKKIELPILLTSIREALSHLPAGRVTEDTLSFSVGMDPMADTIESLRNIPLSLEGRMETLGTFADVLERPLPSTTRVFAVSPEHSVKQAVYLRVFKVKTSDIVDAGTSVKKALAALDRELGTNSHIVFDGPEEIDQQFGELSRDFLITIGLVLLLLFLFFGIRQSLMAALAIPFTIFLTFTVMQLGGLSISFIALFSLLIALGILVDNAIVITAAFTSYFRTGRFTATETVLLVYRDFRGVIFATTLTTVWAFVPLLLSTGIIGEFIRAIPIVVSSALIISALAALFLVLPFIAILFDATVRSRVRLIATLFGVGIVVAVAAFFFREQPYRGILVLDTLLWIGAFFFGWKLLLREWPHLTSRYPSLRHASSSLRNFSDHGIISLDQVALRYQDLLLRIFASKRSRRTTLGLVIATALFSYLLLPLGFVVNEFFPKTDEDLIFVGVELPQGTSATESERIDRLLLEQLRDIPEILIATSEVGQSIPEGSQGASAGVHQSLLTLRLTPAADRDRSAFSLADELKHRFAFFQDGTLSVVTLSGGPPAGSDIELRLSGDSLETLRGIAAPIAEWLRAQPGVTNIRITPESGAGKLSFRANPVALTEHGIAPSQVALLLRAASDEGLTVKDDLRLDDDRESREVTIRLSEERTPSPEIFGTLSLPGASGVSVPLSSLGTFNIEPNQSLITRKDGKRVLRVSAALDPSVSVSETNAQLIAHATTIHFPEGYGFSTGGVNEENEKSVRSILLAMILSAFLIFATMVLQLGSFRKAVIVLLVIPLAVSGVFLLFALTKTPLSFPALIGVLALFGIVVNNSIIMVDRINKNLENGMPVGEAAADGAASRLEPILLTALTTIVGLIPITFADPIWRGLGGAIIAGLFLSGIMKLFFIPLVYYAWFKDAPSPQK